MLILMSGTLGHIITSQNTVNVYVVYNRKGQSVILNSNQGNVLLLSETDVFSAEKTAEVIDTLFTEKQLMVTLDNQVSEDTEALFDYKQVLMYDKIYKDDCTVSLWDKATLEVFCAQGQVYVYFICGGTSMLVLPSSGDAADIPENMQNPDVLITSGMIGNMELLSFKTLISNGSNFRSGAVVDFYSQRNGKRIAVTDTINFDIVG